MQKIEALLTDIDDTHLFTNRHFWYWMEKAIGQVCDKAPEIDPVQFHAALDRYSVDALKTPGISVTRNRWRLVMSNLAKDYPRVDQTIFEEARATIDMVYQFPPKLRLRAVESLRETRTMGIRVM